MLYPKQIRSELENLLNTLGKSFPKDAKNVGMAAILAGIDEAISNIKETAKKTAVQSELDNLKKKNKEDFNKLAQENAVVKAALETFDKEDSLYEVNHLTGGEAKEAMKLAFPEWLDKKSISFSTEKEATKAEDVKEQKLELQKKEKAEYLEVHDKDGKLLMSYSKNEQGHEKIKVSSNDLNTLEKAFEFAGTLGWKECTINNIEKLFSEKPEEMLKDLENYHKAMTAYNEKHPDKKMTISKETITAIKNIKNNEEKYIKAEHKATIENLLEEFKKLMTKSAKTGKTQKPTTESTSTTNSAA